MAQGVALLVWLVVPFWVVAIDLVALLVADKRPVLTIAPDSPTCVRFEVLVPIYGDIRFLENVAYLARYGERVVLCTTNEESDAFYVALGKLARRHRFRVFRTDVNPRSAGAGATGGERSVAAPVRDKLIRDALHHVRAPYVVCIDADTVTTEPIEKLVGVVQASGVDIASVRLVTANRNGLLARFQGHEYRMAMRMRRLYPWLISGACHVARTEVHREVMDRHSLFFQGNDAELGILADAMGYEVGHVLFDVPTTVPSAPRSWWRQRFAWAGGEFRIYAVNVRLGWRHRWFWFYGLVIVLLFAPLRWLSLFQDPRTVAVVLGLYVLSIVGVNWRTRDWALPLLPLYMLFTTLVLVPLSAWSYARMAIRHRNGGVIDPARWVAARPSVARTSGSSVAPLALATDPMAPSCMSVSALGARYSVPYHLSRDRLYVSLKRGAVRIGRRANGRMVVVARHPRVDPGTWSILEVHLPPVRTETSAPTLEEMLDLWSQEVSPRLPARRRTLEGTTSP